MKHKKQKIKNLDIADLEKFLNDPDNPDIDLDKLSKDLERQLDKDIEELLAGMEEKHVD